MQRFKKILVGTAGFLALVAGACSTVEQADIPEAVSQTAAAASNAVTTEFSGDRPAMWHLEDDDTQIYLFGTFHLLPPEIEWQTAAMEAALAATDITLFEADTTSPQAQQELQQAIQEYGLNPPGTTLSSILGEERAAKFGQVAGQYGLPLAQLEPLKPWLASLTLTVIAYQQAGFDPNSGVEMVLEPIAKAQGDQIGYLESGVSQIKALASLDDQQDFASFDEGLEQLANVKEEIGKLLEAWRTGNVANMETLLVRGIRDISEQSFQVLLVNRNANWVTQINDMMAGEGDYFIAVGAGHLVGEDSVVEMLKEQGFSVNRVQ